MARENLKKARQKAGMTQQALADRLGISLIYYQKIEAGNRNGQFGLWDKLEDLFNVPQRELRGDISKPCIAAIKKNTTNNNIAGDGKEQFTFNGKWLFNGESGYVWGNHIFL